MTKALLLHAEGMPLHKETQRPHAVAKQVFPFFLSVSKNVGENLEERKKLFTFAHDLSSPFWA